VPTLTDRRPALWVARRHQLDLLAMNRAARSAVCGCTRCGDQDRGQELDVLITLSLARIDEISNQICDVLRVSAAV